MEVCSCGGGRVGGGRGLGWCQRRSLGALLLEEQRRCTGFPPEVSSTATSAWFAHSGTLPNVHMYNAIDMHLHVAAARLSLSRSTDSAAAHS